MATLKATEETTESAAKATVEVVSSPRPRSGGAATTAATPTLGGRVPDVEPRPLGRPKPPFYICAHPHRWQVSNGRVVPQVKHFSGTPGANGVDRSENGLPVMSTAIAQFQEQGWTVIPWDVDGPGTSYLRKVSSTGGWIDRWTTVYPGSPAESFDESGFYSWLEKLIARGVLKAPPLFVLTRIREATQIARDQYSDRGAERHAKQIARCDIEAAALDALIASMATPDEGAAFPEVA